MNDQKKAWKKQSRVFILKQLIGEAWYYKNSIKKLKARTKEDKEWLARWAVQLNECRRAIRLIRGKQKRCPTTKKDCPEHLIRHGQEAEELRKGIEEALAAAEALADDPPKGDDYADLRDRLQHLLDETDARDSLAFVEAEDGERY